MKDPHSPQVFCNIYAWIGWIYVEGPMGKGIEYEYISDLCQPEMYILEIVPWFPVYLVHFLWYYNYGIATMVFVSMWSSILCQLLTLYFNVAFHKHETDHTQNCQASDIPYDILSNIFGEAYHKHHHKYPGLKKRPGLDIPYWTFIKPMTVCGFFY
tara:strand:+ start:2755 stop:3222 length:468 start_codon:yes stop_codon:yes gene_type:complete